MGFIFTHLYSQTYQILTNDDQMLILGLSYLITTVSPQFWVWPRAHLRGLTNYFCKYIFDGWTYFIANICRIAFCLLKNPKSRSYYSTTQSKLSSQCNCTKKKMFFLINAIQLDWSLAHFSFVFSFGTRPGRFDIAKMHHNGILLPKLFWPTMRKIVLVIEKNFWNSSLNAKNFAKILRSLEQFIQTVKGQNNFW